MKKGRITARELKILSGHLRSLKAQLEKTYGADMAEQTRRLKSIVLKLWDAADDAQEPLNRMTRILHMNRHD